MKLIRWFIGAILCLAGLAIAAGTVQIGMEYKEAIPILLKPAEEAQNRAATLMDAVCDGDYVTAGSMILGNPNLGVDRDVADPAGALIWNALAESISYEFVGECYTTGSGLAQSIRVSYLDLGSVTKDLKTRAQTLLESRVQNAKDISDVYDENNEYREDVVMEVLYDAVEEALQQDAEEVTMEFTVNMVYQDGEWWVISDSTLLKAISGGIVS